MCKNLWVDNGWYCDYLSKMEKVGIEFDPKTDPVSCRLLLDAEHEIILARWDRGEDYIPF